MELSYVEERDYSLKVTEGSLVSSRQSTGLSSFAASNHNDDEEY